MERKRVVQDGWTTESDEMPGMPCWLGLNMESNGESVMRWTGKWRDPIFICEISLWLQCGNGSVIKTRTRGGD